MTKLINVLGTKIVLQEQNDFDFISLTDIAKYKSDKPDLVIQNWIRTHNTIDYLWKWEVLHNPNFNPFIFEGFKSEAWENAFIMTPKKWIENTKAIWIISKPWRYGWTFAHKDIAFKFASWISVEFELYIIKEFQRLKEEELERKNLGWDVKREIAKINYKIQTDAIKDILIPTLWELKKKFIYADEADLLNILVFWKTAKMWRDENKDEKWNIRDFANVYELVILSNLENFNAELIRKWLSQEERYEILYEIVQNQRKSLIDDNIKKLEKFECKK